MNLNLKPELTEAAVAVLGNDLNARVLESVSPLAKLLQDSPSDNPMEEKIKEAAMAFQSSYNSLTESLDRTKEEMLVIDEIREALEKRDNGEVNKVTATTDTQRVARPAF